MTTYIHEPPIYKGLVAPIECEDEYITWTGGMFGDLDLIKEGWSERTKGKIKYPVITLCGSTKFPDQFKSEMKRLALEGTIVLSVSFFGHDGDLSEEECTDGHPTKTMLDDIHKRKIDMSDGIHVINVDGYIGTSTLSEIEYAILNGKTVTYMEEPNGH